MLRRWSGPLITTAILGGVVLILVLNLNVGTKTGKSSPLPGDASTGRPEPPSSKPGENPIGDPVDRNHVEVAAVWLRAAAMEGMDVGGADLIHLEADVKATEGNPNGFALGEFVPYLKIMYTITRADAKEVDKGVLRPMVASDGLHYGANVSMPKAGRFRLSYAIEPPSAGGLGRHTDPAGGVAPWWEPFRAEFDWDYPGPPAVAVKAGR